jgi:hypothetical protein
MEACHGLRLVALTAIIVFGFLWLYWLQQILADVNKALPTSARWDWKGWSEFFSGPTNVRWRNVRIMHWSWDEHVRLFPASHKRIYCALSLILFFTIPIACLIPCLLAGAISEYPC